MSTSAIVVGGGLSGIAAALRLADAGATVQLVEGRPRLGGAAFSFRRRDLSIDNGQHVFLRCCEAYRELVRRLDGENNVVLQPRLSIPVLAPGGRSAKLSRLPGVPAPLHLSAALAGYRLLSVTERARAVAGALALRRLDPANAALDAQTLGAFLRDHGQTDAIITALWGVVGTATLNLNPNEASLALAAKVFRTGLLDHAPASDVGYAATPLGALHSDAAAQALDAAGVEVLLAHRAERVQPVDAGMSVAARTSRRFPPAGRRRGCTRGTPLRGLSGGTGSCRDAGCRGGGPRLQRDRQRACHLRPPGHRPAIRRRGSLAGAMVLRPHGYVRAQARGNTWRLPCQQLTGSSTNRAGRLQARYVAALADLLPAATRATVVDAFVTRERRATFRQAAGSAARRPAADTGVDGLWLAGAWTDTGWPDTMESAVRSGLAAADGVLGAAGSRGSELAA